MLQIINSGATTILVSHSINQVQKLCNKVLWLHRGHQITFTEDVASACAHYSEFLQGDRKTAPVFDSDFVVRDADLQITL